MHRIYAMSVASVYTHYVNKVEKKGRTREELDEALRWLTQLDQEALEGHLEAKTTFQDFFDAVELHPNATLIKGVVCGVRVEEVDEPLMRKIRYMDKLVDEIARGKAMEKVLRG